MKKNRNAFFAENTMNFQGYNPLVPNTPYQNLSANNSLYSGPIPNQMPLSIPNEYNDIMERLAKIERQLNRLDHRINVLESNKIKSTDDFESTTNNMYIL